MIYKLIGEVKVALILEPKEVFFNAAYEMKLSNKEEVIFKKVKVLKLVNWVLWEGKVFIKNG